MTDTTDQEKERQEEEMAGGPVSAGASNKSAPMQNQQPAGDTSKQGNQDYEALTNNRNMGTVGGGNIPGGVSTSNSTVEGGGRPSGENVGEGASAERGSVKNSSVGTSSAATNTIDKSAQSSSGGRHPSQPQTAMGDQDATQSRSSGDEVIEPMSSRAPDKISKKQE